MEADPPVQIERIQTPQRTPISSPPISSRAFSHMGTPDQSIGSLVEQSLMRNDEESITEIGNCADIWK